MIEKKGSAVPVRLTEAEKMALTQIAEETGLTASTLIRLLISSLETSYKRNGNTITLPLCWRRLIADNTSSPGKKNQNFELF